MLIKYRIYEIARDMGVTSKEVIDLLQKYIPVENARKHNSVLHEHELNVVSEVLSKENKVSDIQKYLSMTPSLDKKVEEKTSTETTTAVPNKTTPDKTSKPVKQSGIVEKKTGRVSYTNVNEKSNNVVENTNNQRFSKSSEQTKPHTGLKEGTNKKINTSSTNTNNKDFQQSGSAKPAAQTPNRFSQNVNSQAHKGPQQINNRFQNSNYNQSQNKYNPGNNDYQGNKDNRNNNQQTQQRSYNSPQRNNNSNGFRQNNNNTNTFNKKPFVRPPAKSIPDSQKLQGTQTVDIRTVDVNLDKYNEKYEKIVPTNLTHADYSNKQKIVQKSAQRARQQFTKRETEAEKLRRLEEQRLKNRPSKIIIPEELVVGELASKLKVPATQVIKKLMMLGIMASVTQIIDFETASLIADEFGVKSEKEVTVTIEDRLFDETEDKKDDLEPRNPVVVVMGHVDHGKTSLLDAIRNADVISTEAGGITQHIGAYRVNIDGRYITFLDTPGHEAFTSMRARGAQITDIAILVVAADDGIMPQTVEAINHAKAAGVSIIVAINKIDKPGANLEKIKQELTEYELVPEEWGGDTICVPVSAKTRENIDTLLEMVQLVADVKDLKANPNRLAKGAVIEAKLDKGRGPIATVLVQNGTLKNGDIIIAGTSIGKVRTMLDDRGRKVIDAGPSTPVEITGLSEVPCAGDVFNVVEDERLAKELVDKRKHELKQEKFSSYQKVTLDNLFSQISEGEIKELPVIVKADVNGSVEAIRQSLEKLSNQEVRVRVIHGGVGAINKSDVMLANASNAIIIGFNVRPDPVARDSAALDGVDIRFYRVIYDAIDEIKSAMKGMLAPKVRELELGRVEIRQVYKVSNIGTVAGCYVTEGKITRNAKIRVVRDGVVIADDVIKSLKRFKDDVKEVAQGYECGICLEKFNDIKDHDILEAYVMEEYRDE